MDPQSVAFTPHGDLWRFQSEMLRVQQTQAEHAERLLRLERRTDEDARQKSIWGTSSPFPSVLSGGTPQQAPLHQPVADTFSGFDDQSTNLIGSLHLDPEYEPRRTGGATSRAASVRFDETANQGHWSHTSRASFELIPRTGSSHSLGGHAMSERSYSHKSDARSVQSATSGRANSLGLDAVYGLSNQSSGDPPGLAPGLFILGSVPSIIRCWLDTNFKHESLLYAAVCTGSYTSFLDMRLINRLGFSDRVTMNENGERKIKLFMYLPEAIPHPASSRSSSPAPQLPSLTINFTVFETSDDLYEPKAIQIFLGSDILRSHNADILFSSNTLTMFDDDGSKLSIPLVRPEDDRSFKCLQVTSIPISQQQQRISGTDPTKEEQSVEDEGIHAASDTSAESITATAPPGFLSVSSNEARPTTSGNDSVAASSSSENMPASPALVPLRSLQQRPSLGRINTRGSTDEPLLGSAGGGFLPPPGSASATASRTTSQTGVWSNWRRDSTASATSAPGSGTYQRKDTGIKVLKPMKLARTSSSSVPQQQAQVPTHAQLQGQGQAQIQAPNLGGIGGNGQSRNFDEGKSRAGGNSVGDLEGGVPTGKRLGAAAAGLDKLTGASTGGGIPLSQQLRDNNNSNSAAAAAAVAAAAATAPPTGLNRTRSANPLGGGTAFAWLNANGRVA